MRKFFLNAVIVHSECMSGNTTLCNQLLNAKSKSCNARRFV